jgi:hypothetical protein
MISSLECSLEVGGYGAHAGVARLFYRDDPFIMKAQSAGEFNAEQPPLNRL